MSDDRDFDWVRGKVPRRSRDGEDISGDDLGSGGRRRDDGTLSGLVYDLEYDEDDQSEEHEGHEPKQGSGEEIIGAAIGAALAVGGALFIKWAAPRVKKFGEETAIPAIKKKAEDVKRKFTGGKDKEKTYSDKETSQNEIEAISTQTVLPDFAELDTVYDEYAKNMSNEEIQRHLINIAVHYIALMNELRALSGVRVTRGDWDAAIEKLTAPNMIGAINQILGSNPALIEQSQAETLSSILGHQIVANGEYQPIEMSQIKEALKMETDND